MSFSQDKQLKLFPLQDVKLDGAKGDVFLTEDYEIPQKLMLSKDEKFKVKFEAKSGSVAGGVFEAMLMRKAQ